MLVRLGDYYTSLQRTCSICLIFYKTNGILYQGYPQNMFFIESEFSGTVRSDHLSHAHPFRNPTVIGEKTEVFRIFGPSSSSRLAVQSTRFIILGYTANFTSIPQLDPKYCAKIAQLGFHGKTKAEMFFL